MSFFPRSSVTSSQSSFTPLFRLLEDFDSYSRESNGNSPRRAGQSKSFTPKFDVKELADAYELHGELPGIEQKDIQIEFVDLQTLTVRGRTERQYSSGTPPAGLLGDAKPAEAISVGYEEIGQKDHHATVEDENAPNATGESTASPGAEVVKHDGEAKPQEPQARYWVTERSIGEFSRAFKLPVPVDQDNVRASLKDGILSIVVPKKRVESRKITIS